ncbi:MAG: hypothetical protein EXR68_07935 [Dehalococcoidia bacterium]|nr:hypothetical protein [Dehalococcoidia bacterium]
MSAAVPRRSQMRRVGEIDERPQKEQRVAICRGYRLAFLRHACQPAVRRVGWRRARRGDTDGDCQAAAALIRSRHTVVLAGAGISKESGIQTFRGDGGLWTTQGEPPMNQYETFAANSKRWWERWLEDARAGNAFGASIEAAQPNTGHRALAKLEEIGRVAHVISQNIDDRHRLAGQRSLTEIHDNRMWMSCVRCGTCWPREEFPIDEAALPPRCSSPGCTGVVKSYTVMFSEPILPLALARCEVETAQADCFITVGTPPSSIPLPPSRSRPLAEASR